MEQHGGFPGYYLAASFLVFFPWVTLVPSAIAGAWRRRSSDPNLGFLLGWAIGPLFLLECFRTKLIHYYLPAYPAWALLTAWLARTLIAEGANLRRNPLGRFGLGTLAVMGGGGAIGLFAALRYLPQGLHAPLVALALILGSGSLVGFVLLRQARTRPAMACLIATIGLFMFLLAGWLIPAAEPYRTSRIVGERLARIAWERNVPPLLFTYQEPGLIYALGRPAPTIKDARGLHSRLAPGQSAVTVLLPHERDQLRRKHQIEVTTLEEIEALSLTKGQRHRLQFAVIRRPHPSETAESGGSAETASSVGGRTQSTSQQILVK
jgi:hypothetical protein